MKTITDNFLAAIKTNALLHGLWMAIGVAILKVVYPAIQAMLDGQAYVMPTWQSIVKIALAAAVGYFGKNVLFGSSAKAEVAIIKTDAPTQ